jgi:multiple sugar transport system ATP-binding protein
VTLGFRPEALDVVPVGTPGSFDVEVNLVEELGSDAFVYGTLKGDTDLNLTAGETNQLIVRIDPRSVPDKGDVIAVSIQAGHSHVFSATTGERLG